MDTREVGNSILKSIFATIPFAGQPLSEIFLEYRGRIKQNRFNAFTELLEAYFSDKSDVDFSTFNHVEFSDLFEAVIQRVVRTDSSKKHERFRDILTNYIETPNQPIDHAETFLDLVSSLNEPAIQILKFHDVHDKEFNEYDRKDTEIKDAIKDEELRIEKEREAQKNILTLLPKSRSNIDRLNGELRHVQEKIKQLTKYRSASFYSVSDDDFMYLKQILVSKALLADSSIGTYGHIPYFHMRITVFGKQFIRYITEGK